MPNTLASYHPPQASYALRLKKGINTFTSNVLKSVLPNKTKRLIFLSSFVASIENMREPNKELVLKINKLLVLSHQDEAISLPMYVHSVIWKNHINKLRCPIAFENTTDIRDIKDKTLTIKQMRAFSNVIINKAPSWMIYGSRKTIREDLILIFKNLPSITNACF